MLVNNVFDGLVRDMAAALFAERALSDQDVRELKTIFKDKKK